MFRSLSEDSGGFVNGGLEISDENGKVEGSNSLNEELSTKIEITRSKYTQQKLHDEMLYRKPPSKSGEFFCSSLFNIFQAQAQEQIETALYDQGRLAHMTCCLLIIITFRRHF